jgi:predicted amidohydrolase
MNLLLKGGHVIDPSTGTDAVTDIRIVEGKIGAMGRDLSPLKGEEV